MKHDQAQPQTTERTSKDYAIEFGEYLAKSTERLIAEINRSQQDGNDGIDADIWRDVQNSIYEFRKRAARAVAGGERD